LQVEDAGTIDGYGQYCAARCKSQTNYITFHHY